MDQPEKLTIAKFLALPRQSEKIIAVTAYDALMARLADEAGVHLLLVGDSVGNVLLGYKNTLAVTLEQSLHHTAAVVRGTRRALVIGDLPFLSYQVNDDEAVRNAGRYLKEAGADGVKLEGDATYAPLIRRLVRTGIPVMGHLGIMPQRAATEGGYRVHGRKEGEAAALLADALALQEAGVFAIVLEGVVMEVSKQLSEQLEVPTIGIGAGPHCDGQIQVAHDLLGLFEGFLPRHTRRYAHLAEDIRQVLRQYGADVRAGAFPTEENSFK